MSSFSFTSPPPILPVFNPKLFQPKSSTSSVKQGLQGEIGQPGHRGFQGLNGLVGNRGFQGFNGIRGFQGFNGNRGFQGFIGEHGFQGLQGLQGLQGNQGNQGLQGNQGNQGLQGLQGLQGNQGLQGLQGLQGNQGLQGLQGFSGLQGIDGTNGLSNTNTQTQSQLTVAGVNYYITNSNLQLPSLVVGTRISWRICMSKNNFGTTNFYIGIYRGLNGNMTDTRDVLQTLGTQTAVVDNMTLFVNITITAIGVNGSYYWTILPINKAVSLTGFGIQTGQNAFRSGTVSNVDLSIPSQQWGISFQSQTGTPTILIPFVSVKAFNLS